MAWVIVTPNPFEPLASEKLPAFSGTIREWVTARYPKTGEWPTPTVCFLNGHPLKRDKWDHPIGGGDVINFVALQGGPLVFIIVAVVLMVAMVGVTLLMGQPDPPSDNPGSDPVFSLKGQGNAIRLSEPIECSYGRNRIYPSYAARPYFRYKSNDQFQYAIFCIGQGKYDVHDIQIGNSAITNYQEAEYQLVEPGGEVTLFPTNVYTAPEAGGQLLYAVNQPEYVAPGWVGPFAANPSGTTTTTIEVDLAYPKGIFTLTETGQVSWMTVAVSVQKRQIDDAGLPISAWTAIDSHSYWQQYGATQSPWRETRKVTVPLGRWEVRMKNVGYHLTSSRVGMDVTWEGLRSWLPETSDYGDVTLLAVQIRATANLNNQTSQLINVIATRKLPIRQSSGEWSEPVATRSIVWAFVDVFRAQYGGRITDDIFYDWDALEALDALYTARGEYFDWIFRDASTVWDTAKTVAQVGRAVPLITGSLISMKRDGPLEIPVAMFNQENIVDGSFDWAIKLWDLDEYDSARVEYTEASTGYKQETVMCLLPGGDSNHPRDVRLPGIQDRTHAYRAGLYMLASDRYLRENVTFETGLEGYLPTFGDLVAITHDVPKWGQGGYVVNAERLGTYQVQLWLSEPLNWVAGQEHHIILRGNMGQIIGPLAAFRTTDSMQCTLNTETDIDFLLTGKTEPMLFLFGIVGSATRYMKVVRVEPSGSEKVKITAINNESVIHSFDALTPSPLGAQPYAPVMPDLPEIGTVFLSVISGPLLVIQISWTSAFGATEYVVQTSTDDINWADRARITQTSVQLPVQLGMLYVRVAAIAVEQGPWSEASISVGAVSGLALSVQWDVDTWSVTWWDVLNKLGWVVRVYDYTSESEPVLKRTTNFLIADERIFTYDLADAGTDGNVVRDMLVEVDVLFRAESGTGTQESGSPSQLVLHQALPEPSTDLAAVISTDQPDPGLLYYDLSWTPPAGDDFLSVKLWKSETSGFDPQIEIPVWSSTSLTPVSAAAFVATTQIVLSLDSNSEHPPIYWRIAYFDCWGNEFSTNVTAEQTIPAYA